MSVHGHKWQASVCQRWQSFESRVWVPDKFTNLSTHLRHIHNPKSQHRWQMTKEYQDTFKVPQATIFHNLQHYLHPEITHHSSMKLHSLPYLSKTEQKSEKFPLLLKLLTCWKVEANDDDRQCMMAVLSSNCPWNGVATYLHQENNLFKEYLLVAVFASFAKIPQEGNRASF